MARIEAGAAVDGLERMRAGFSRALMVFTWVAVLAVMAAGWSSSAVSSVVVIASSLLLGALVTAVWLREGTGVRTRLASALSLAGLVSLMVAALGGADPAQSFQIDAHMLFFAMLALLAGWVDWRALVAFAGAVALHHLTLNIALPALVFPGGADFTRVLFHAVVLVIEAGALVWLTLRLEAAFSAASRSLAEAEEAGRESERMRKAQDDLAERERLRRTEVEAAIAGFRSEIETELSRVGDRSRSC